MVGEVTPGSVANFYLDEMTFRFNNRHNPICFGTRCLSFLPPTPCRTNNSLIAKSDERPLQGIFRLYLASSNVVGGQIKPRSLASKILLRYPIFEGVCESPRALAALL